MPVRSLNSSIFRWPDAKTVHRAVHQWMQEVLKKRVGICRIGYFGSYARGDWGVGSDLDLLVIVEKAEPPFEQRPLEWDTLELPVPTDLLVYTLEEWESLVASGSRFSRMLEMEAVWVYEGKPSTIV